MKKEIIREKFNLKSSLLEYIIYDYQRKELEVKYKRGKYKGETKVYRSITRDDLYSIIEGPSPGKALLKIVNKKHEKLTWWGYILDVIKN